MAAKKSKAPDGIEIKDEYGSLTIHLPPNLDLWMRFINQGYLAAVGCLLVLLCFGSMDSGLKIVLLVGAGVMLIIGGVALFPKRTLIKVFHQGIEVYETPSYNVIKPLICNITAVYPEPDADFSDWFDLVVEVRERGAQFLLRGLNKTHAHYVSNVIRQYLTLDTEIISDAVELKPETAADKSYLVLRTADLDYWLYQLLIIGYCVLLFVLMPLITSPSMLVFILFSGIIIVPLLTSICSRLIKGVYAITEDGQRKTLLNDIHKERTE